MRIPGCHFTRQTLVVGTRSAHYPQGSAASIATKRAGCGFRKRLALPHFGGKKAVDALETPCYTAGTFRILHVGMEVSDVWTQQPFSPYVRDWK